MTGWIVLALIAVAVVWIIGMYNALVSLRNRFKNSYAQIDVQLNRRHDLIPNLVETAKGYLKHERETLEAVIAARNVAVTAGRVAAAHPEDAQAMLGINQAEGSLTGALSRFFAVAEAYPDLKASTTMNQVMEELSSTENKVAFARQAYNDAVMAYNTYREQFPRNFIAAQFNFNEAALFEVTEEQVRAPVKVSFT